MPPRDLSAALHPDCLGHWGTAGGTDHSAHITTLDTATGLGEWLPKATCPPQHSSLWPLTHGLRWTLKAFSAFFLPPPTLVKPCKQIHRMGT